MPGEDQVQSVTMRLASEARAAREDSTPNAGDSRSLLIDFDGFFKSVTEMGEHSVSEAMRALPLGDLEAARAQTYLQLFDNAAWFPFETPDRDLRALRTVWSAFSLKSAIIASRNGAEGTDSWAAFYASDLHDHMRARHPTLEGTSVKLTLSRRLVARTQRTTRTIYISAITRNYLLNMNLALANYVETVLDDGIPLSKIDTLDFFEFVLSHSLPLHRPLALSTEVALPLRTSAAQFAQRITQIQMTFLTAHEYGHLALQPDPSLDADELACDDFAFGTLKELETPGWLEFLAVRWLFEVLAFDRVLAECMALDDDDWESADWLQGELRDRRPIERFPERLPEVLSAPEMIGSLFLLDLKSWLRRLGPDYLRARLQRANRLTPLLSGEEFTAMAQRRLSGVPDDVILSASQLLREIRGRRSDDRSA